MHCVCCYYYGAACSESIEKMEAQCWPLFLIENNSFSGLESLFIGDDINLNIVILKITATIGPTEFISNFLAKPVEMSIRGVSRFLYNQKKDNDHLFLGICNGCCFFCFFFRSRICTFIRHHK